MLSARRPLPPCSLAGLGVGSQLDVVVEQQLPLTSAYYGPGAAKGVLLIIDFEDVENLCSGLITPAEFQHRLWSVEEHMDGLSSGTCLSAPETGAGSSGTCTSQTRGNSMQGNSLEGVLSG